MEGEQEYTEEAADEPQVSEIEQEARKQGWVPKDEWRGDPDKWRDAGKFVEYGKEIIPILRDRLSKMERTYEMAMRKIKDVEKKAFERAKVEYDQKLAELDRKELEAFNIGDATEYQHVKNERGRLKPPEEPKAEPAEAGNGDFLGWQTENKWFGTDRAMTAYAREMSVEIQARTGLPDGRELYDKVSEEVRKEFAHKFQNQRRQAAASVDSGSSAASSGAHGDKRVYANLPKSAKTECNRLIKDFEARGVKFTKEEYCASYQWE